MPTLPFRLRQTDNSITLAEDVSDYTTSANPDMHTTLVEETIIIVQLIQTAVACHVYASCRKIWTAFSLLGQFAPWNKSANRTLANSLSGTFAPRSLMAQELTYCWWCSTAQLNVVISGTRSGMAGRAAAISMWNLVWHHHTNQMKSGQLILRKINKIVATRCQILRLKCTKIDFS